MALRLIPWQAMTAEQKVALTNWASKHEVVASVWLFGSRSRGNHRPDSDYDIALELRPKPDRVSDPAYTEFFYGYEEWKAEIRLLLKAEISLVCYRDDLHCKFDPRVKLIWSRALPS